uniref:Uncharacterized protein n=1 Tax=Chromera velia CCMP2878 TaxID=1169474 RepID=A0A0G4HYD1_9ALVE|eukprot:Cvel_33503.t1-p1 / transcript=Cvel_33503.t1 / gene=Cvel_33503 / organism=Chromera_velia_CCMP2878 / gene_product=hypothetical protein / transcript_product=hypothetical protein / location=Cvel_scaffold5460:2377-2940(+) / protein_length=188 / sequence_SO=supercontig / SO=protein_coding / is_pseudo=false
MRETIRQQGDVVERRERGVTASRRDLPTRESTRRSAGSNQRHEENRPLPLLEEPLSDSAERLGEHAIIVSHAHAAAASGSGEPSAAAEAEFEGKELPGQSASPKRPTSTPDGPKPIDVKHISAGPTQGAIGERLSRLGAGAHKNLVAMGCDDSEVSRSLSETMNEILAKVPTASLRSGPGVDQAALDE